MITSQHVTGFAVGVGAAAVAFYLYKKNQPAVDEWLHKQGIQMPSSAARDDAAMTLEELVAEKERLEDIIAEREYAASAPETAEEPS